VVRVLTVDDHAPFLKVAQELVRATPGFESAGEASSAEEGLAAVRDAHPDLVLADIHMPDMSGIEFFRIIRERHPHVCRIMLTADPERDTIIRAINEGEVYRFIPKPWSNTVLRVTVYFAFEAIQLQEENRRLLTALRRQLHFVRTLEKDFPYLAALARQEEAELLLAQADRLGDE